MLKDNFSGIQKKIESSQIKGKVVFKNEESTDTNTRPKKLITSIMQSKHRCVFLEQCKVMLTFQSNPLAGCLEWTVALCQAHEAAPK